MKTLKSSVSSKGQITLPAAIRDKLGLVTGTAVRFELRGGGVLVSKGSSGPHPVDRAFGRIVLSKPVDALVDEMRGPRPRRARTPARRRR
jgi:AbrB family looped-hinge helix DNA binding protein